MRDTETEWWYHKPSFIVFKNGRWDEHGSNLQAGKHKRGGVVTLLPQQWRILDK
jgi:hypothetical protein